MKNILTSLMMYFVISIAFVSCTTPKKILYLQNASSLLPAKNVDYEVEIKPDDLLRITVSTKDMETAMPYNKLLPAINQNTTAVIGQQTLDSYLVKQDGTIYFNEFGNLKVDGLSLKELSELLKSKLLKVLKEPDVEVRLLNFKFTILGEVKRPGTFSFNDNRITLVQALGYAGDLTIDGRRDNILVIRDNGKEQRMIEVDITSASFINSPAYYLEQNDMIIVDPNKAKAGTGGYLRYAGTFATIASLMISTFILIESRNQN